MAGWFVARTQSNRERWAAENVLRQGYVPYLPMLLETGHTKQGGRRVKVARSRPLFPSYLFVQTEGQWRFLTGTFGISNVVMVTNDRPAMVTDREINRIKGTEVDGMVCLPKDPDQFVPEQPVRLTAGAFSGHKGLFQGYSDAERVRVLLDFLGRKISLLVPETQLEAA